MATTAEVIEALQQEGLADDVIKMLVPILAYESRVDGVPYVLTAIDSESPSYGLGQANITSMESAYWMAFNELNIDLPGQTQQQADQWRRAGYDVNEEDVRDFTPEQKEFVINYMKTADLEFNAKLIKHMLHQKELEQDLNPMDAIKDLYKLTIAKINQPDRHPESAAFKSTIDAEVEEYYSMPPTTTTVPETTTTTVPETTTTTTPTTTTTMPETTVPQVDVGFDERSPGIINQFGTPPQDQINTGAGGNQSFVDNFNENFSEPVGPITQIIRDKYNAKEQKSITQIIEMLLATTNKRRAEKGMKELDKKNILEKRMSNLIDRDNQFFRETGKMQFPGSSVPFNIEDVTDFLDE